MVISASLVVLLSAFNGIESMVAKLYSEYDAAITIRSEQGKTFDSTRIDLSGLRAIPEVKSVSKAIEETIILKNQKKWVNAKMVGVDYAFLDACHLDQHLVDGYPDLEQNDNPTAVIGASLLDKLDGFISQLDGYQELTVYAPLREASISKRKSPFSITPIRVVGRMNYNKDVNMSELLVPLNYARTVLNYDKDISALYLDVPNEKAEFVKEKINALIGPGFVVKTAAEKNELIFKTSKSEKKIVMLILLFIFILAAFNLVASLYMLYIEKAQNIRTMINFGATARHIFYIFFLEGVLIALIGIVLGIGVGVLICQVQIHGQLLIMPGTNDAFPVIMNPVDLLWIIGMVFSLSVVMSFIPVRFLVKRDF